MVFLYSEHPPSNSYSPPKQHKCGTHFIRGSVLDRMVLRHIQLVTGYILHHREYLISVMGKKLRLESAEKVDPMDGIYFYRERFERALQKYADKERLTFVDISFILWLLSNF